MLPTLLAASLAVAAFARPEAIVSTDWLAQHLNDAGVRIVAVGREDVYAKGHVPGAVFLSNDALRDPANAPTFLPSKDAFERTMRALGISNTTRVVAYDDRGGLYAARLWLVAHVYGFDRVALLDGHVVKWTLEGRPTSTDAVRVASGSFAANAADLRWIATADEVVKAIDAPAVRIVDARTQGEIEGKDLRGIRRGGNIPSSVPVYWEDLMDRETKALKPVAELEALMKARGLGRSDTVIVYCQVGMRASYDLWVLHLLGYDKLRNYYGAWEEWGNRAELPIR
jgi:thiosulfate/3-mercaptopyruvate sulfurtransferase